MENLFGKLSLYLLLNNILPGAVFCSLLKLYWHSDLFKSDTIGNLFMYWFIGIVISRIGSVIVEPFSIKIHLVSFASHDKYITASRRDEKLEVLSGINNAFRTMLTMCLLLMAGEVYAAHSKVQFENSLEVNVLLIALVALFAYSYRKQTRYVRYRVEKNNDGGN